MDEWITKRNDFEYVPAPTYRVGGDSGKKVIYTTISKPKEDEVPIGKVKVINSRIG